LKNDIFQSKVTAAALIALMTFAALLCFTAPNAKSAYDGTAKPMEFYLHSAYIPVNVAGLQSKYIMNTSRSFAFLTADEAYANSLYKPVDQPKITVDYYLYPNLAGPVDVDGLWQVSLWVNGSAYKPARFSLYFQEVTVGGEVIWSQTVEDSTVTSPIGSYIDVPVYNYNLSSTLSHRFTAGTTLHVQAEVNTGATADARIWYESPSYPSKVILPARDYARPVSMKTYSYWDSETSVFFNNWNDSQRFVNIQANVTDPFGTYDIYRVSATITDPAGKVLINDADMTAVSSNEQWIGSYAQLYKLDWDYLANATLGDYTVKVTVVDNNGYYRKVDSGTYNPFREETTQTFTIDAPADIPPGLLLPFWLLLLLAVVAVVVVAVAVSFVIGRKRKISF